MSGVPPPSNLPNGQNGRDQRRPRQNANPLRPFRRRPADPLVARKRNTPPPPRPNPPRPAAESNPLGLNRASTLKSAEQLEKLRKQHGGWSEPMPEACEEYPLVTTKRALREGIRHHIMRFHRPTPTSEVGEGEEDKKKDKGIDPTDPATFTRPVTLHRRDPRQPAPGRVVARLEETPEPKMVDEKEAERQAQIKGEREAQKALDQAKIAPTVKEGTAKKAKKAKEEKIHFNRKARTEQAQKEADLKYEEALPWHLEDVDGRNVWVGNYVSALSGTNVVFVAGDKGEFKMVPLEKWYKFTARAAFERIPEDQVDEFMKKSARPSRWMMQGVEKREEELKMKREYRSGGKRRLQAGNHETRGYDEVDMEGEEFDDDDEGLVLEVEDEDTKISHERIRQNQLGANLFGDGDEKELDALEQHEMRQDQQRRVAMKKLKKATIKREGLNEMESESDDSNPFESSSSEDESEDEDDQKQAKGEDEDKDKIKAEPQDSAPVGVATPSGKQKTSDSPKKMKTLKRPGSPNLSESSGNESARKKAKKSKTASAHQSRSSTPIPGSQSQTAGQRRKIAAGSTSDGEATAGEMSDGQPKKKKIKLVASGGRGTPTGSRPGSPLPGPNAGSPSASPARDGQPSSKSAISASEIIGALPPPPDGLGISAFLKIFNDRVGDGPGKMTKPDLIALIRQNCQYGADKLLRRKN